VRAEGFVKYLCRGRSTKIHRRGTFPGNVIQQGTSDRRVLSWGNAHAAPLDLKHLVMPLSMRVLNAGLLAACAPLDFFNLTFVQFLMLGIDIVRRTETLRARYDPELDVADATGQTSE